VSRCNKSLTTASATKTREGILRSPLKRDDQRAVITATGGGPGPKKKSCPGRWITGRGMFAGSLGLIARSANATSNLAADRGQPVATPGPARPAHRIQLVWMCLVIMRQNLDRYFHPIGHCEYFSTNMAQLRDYQTPIQSCCAKPPMTSPAPTSFQYALA
jgi:hypothetical protein